jgi:O-antigen/teichoic acid export membrane protein
VLQVLCLGMAFRSVGYPSFSLIQAQGRFKTLAILLGFGATLFLILTLTASRFTSDATAAVRVAQVVALYFALEGPITMYIAISRAGGTWGDVWRVYFFPMLLGAVACGVAAAAIRFMPGQTRLHHVWRLFAGAAIAAGIYLPLIRILAPDTWLTFTSRVRSILRI